MSEKYETVFTAVVNGTDRRMVRDGTLAIYDVFTDDGTQWSTFKAEVYNTARQLEGQLADWKGFIEQKDNFTNHTLTAIRMHPNGGQPQQQPRDQWEQPSQGRQAAERAQEAQPQRIDYGEYKQAESEKELRTRESIHRQTAGKVAAEISNTPEEFWANVQDIKVFFDSGVVPLPYKRQSSMRSHPGDEPQEQENWPADSSYYNPDNPDADIPFMPTIDGLGN